MAKISQEEIIKLISLAKLPLDDAVLKSRVKDMEEILGYVAKLAEVDLKDVAPVPGGTDMVNRLRLDAIDRSDEALTEALRHAFPVEEAQMAKVPPILSK
jgi:aspartyl-tRNA(Asn)/glutamyl-tRNA(Gln) amidotransferase subunit C